MPHSDECAVPAPPWLGTALARSTVRYQKRRCFMKLISKVTTGSHARLGLALLTLFAAIAPSAFATDKPSKPQDVPATVVAHLSLPAAPGNQMLLQRKGSKQYLYIQQASKQGYMIVDVTKANEPSVLKRTAPA